MKKIMLFIIFALTLSACGTITIPTLPPNNSISPEAPAANVDINATQQSMNATQQSLIATNQALMAAQSVMETQNALLQMQSSTNATETALASALIQPATPTTYLLPVAETATPTPEPNLLFSDDFENGISNNWQQFGTWMISNGKPILVTPYSINPPSNSISPFEYWIYDGGIVLPGTAQLDNYAFEFDFLEKVDFLILLSYKDEKNYKAISIDDGTAGTTNCSFSFFKDGKQLGIPESLKNHCFNKNYPMTHVRIETRGVNLKLYITEQLIYDYVNLPDSVAGTIGFATSLNDPTIDNVKIYQLP